MNTVPSRVAGDLERLAIPHRIISHTDFTIPIRSPQDFANALERDLGSITKSVLMRTRTGSMYGLVVAPMGRKILFPAAARVLGTGRLEVAPDSVLEESTGFPRNGVSPLGLLIETSVVIDESLLDHASILVSGGITGIEIELRPGDLIRATDAVVANLSPSTAPPP